MRTITLLALLIPAVSCSWNNVQFDKTRPDTAAECADPAGESDAVTIIPQGTIPIAEPDPMAPPLPTRAPGRSYRGIPDPNAHFGFDVNGSYAVDRDINGFQGIDTVFCVGSAADPCVIDGTDAVWTELVLVGQYIILQGGVVNSLDDHKLNAGRCDKCVIRDFEVKGPGIDWGHGTAVYLGSETAWIRGSIHDFGDRSYSARENDLHGIKVYGPNVWILDAHIYNMAGDSVQIGDSSRGSADRVYVGGGDFHNNRENAVDIKDSTNVVISCVSMHGFHDTGNDEFAMVIHDDAFGVLAYDNVIYDTLYGIVSTGEKGHVIDGNTIVAGTIGIQLRNTRDMTVTNNAISARVCIDRQRNVSGTIQRRCK